MGADLFLNPPEGKCLVCGGYSVNTRYPRGECSGCYIKRLRAGLRAALKELGRLRDVHLPMYEGKIGEPDRDVIREVRQALRKRR